MFRPQPYLSGPNKPDGSAAYLLRALADQIEMGAIKTPTSAIVILDVPRDHRNMQLLHRTGLTKPELKAALHRLLQSLS